MIEPKNVKDRNWSLKEMYGNGELYIQSKNGLLK
jgi:hypothetical protein